MNIRPLECKRSYYRPRRRPSVAQLETRKFCYQPRRPRNGFHTGSLPAADFSTADGVLRRSNIHPDPANTNFQYLEHLATGYWQAEVLFAALELDLFDIVDQKPRETAAISRAANCQAAPLERLLNALADLELVQHNDGCWYNRAVTRRYLLSSAPDYLGDFLLYRRYLKPQWAELTSKVTDSRRLVPAVCAVDDYEHRNFCYARATDQLVRRKAEEIAQLLAPVVWSGPVLDVGGGAGALTRHLLADRPDEFGIVMDLPEVVTAARRISPYTNGEPRVWSLGADFRYATPFRPEQKFGLVVLSNFLHAYGAETARELLLQATDLLAAGGHLLIHDYFPDLPNGDTARGALHDLNMMLNTFDGECHRAETLTGWLAEAGIIAFAVESLPSDSGIILATRGDMVSGQSLPQTGLAHLALRQGFRRAVELAPHRVVTAPWVRVKCRFGCGGYGNGLQCPPHTSTHTETRALLKGYRSALLVEGEPPLKQFHRRLLALEKDAFLAGYHRALAFSAGPCRLCKQCDVETACRFPKQARPSMEASGMDVYQTVRNAGLSIHPVQQREDYVKYFGLLMLE